MPIARPDVEQVANAYRAALVAGDTTLGRSIESRILLAVVNESADMTATWLETRVENGMELAKPIREFNQSASKDDVVSRAIATFSARLFNEARSAVVLFTFKGTAPLWLATALGFVGGVFGYAEAFGVVVGFGLAGLLAAGYASRLVYMAVRAAQAAATTDPGATVIATIQSAQSVGSSAMQIFEATAGPAVERLYALTNSPPALPTTVTKLRSAAVTVVILAWTFAAVAAVFFVLGLLEGYAAYKAQTPTFPSNL